jgi:ferredoxin-nitrite reductase
VTARELFDASPVVFALDQIVVGLDGNPEFTNLPRKFNITITGCLENCTHNESQDIALVPAAKQGRFGFKVLVGGKMGSGGFTPAVPLDVFTPTHQAAEVVAELVRIFRDHGPREARAKCRFRFLVDEWGTERLRRELQDRMPWKLESSGRHMRRWYHADHVGVAPQKQTGLMSVGLCVPTGRLNPNQMDELARLAEEYGDGQVRLTTNQNAIIPNVSEFSVESLQREPLLRELSPQPSPFFRRLVACTGTDFCNLAQIETKSRAVELSRALEEKLGKNVAAMSIHWSGCVAGCGNHQAAEIGLRGLKANVAGQLIDAVAVYVGGQTGPATRVGEQVLDAVPCDQLPDVLAAIIQERNLLQGKPAPDPGRPVHFVPLGDLAPGNISPGSNERAQPPE